MQANLRTNGPSLSSRISSYCQARLLRGLLLILCTLLIASCERQGINREQAEAVLSKELGATTQEVWIDLVALDKASERMDFVAKFNLFQGGNQDNILGEDINEVIDPKVTFRDIPSGSSKFISVNLRKPTPLDIQVTGITEPSSESESRTIEFSATYGNIPAIVKLFAYRGYNGRITLRRYDDGWRLAEVLEMRPAERFSESEFQNEVDQLTKKVLERRNLVVQARRQFDERILAACTPQRELSQHDLGHLEFVGGLHRVQGTVSVNDGGIYVSYSYQRYGQREDLFKNYLFSEVRRDQGFPAGFNKSGQLYIGSDYSGDLQFDADKPPNDPQKIIDAINSSFSNWKETNSKLIGECPESPTWGCVNSGVGLRQENLGVCNAERALTAARAVAQTRPPSGETFNASATQGAPSSQLNKASTEFRMDDANLPDAKPKALATPAPEYPPEERSKGIAGTTLLTLTLDAKGIVWEVEVAKSSGNRNLDQAAVNAARQWRFSPRIQGGARIASRIHVPITFR